MIQKSVMENLWGSSFISGGNTEYIEELYEKYINNNNSIPEEWRFYFDNLHTINKENIHEISHKKIIEQFKNIKKNSHYNSNAPLLNTEHQQKESKQASIQRLINNFRICGHQIASLDPLELKNKKNIPELTIEYYGFNNNDLETEFHTNIFNGPKNLKLKQIYSKLQQSYCKNIGSEFMHIVNSTERQWIQNQLEHTNTNSNLSDKERITILDRLNAAEGLEKYLAAKYPGTKRFGLEGAEGLIPLMQELINKSASHGLQEIVIGMAHRGRLNVLVNILGKKPSDLFEEFEGRRKIQKGSGDVKYHQGFSSDLKTLNGTIHLALAFNPSHLEIVSPVVEGSVRARQDRHKDIKKEKVMAVAIHGDAAFAGQGVVMETFQMSQTRAYTTGGTIHIVINNQIGFTTSEQKDARSTEYCTDVAKMIQAPILHVNGDSPEAIIQAIRIAVDYRTIFKKDVIVDLLCYRRLGHNEADEPSSTQPLMYKKIKQQPTTRKKYGDFLVKQKILSEKENQAMSHVFRKKLEQGESVLENLLKEEIDSRKHEDWLSYIGKNWTAIHDTRVALGSLQEIGKKISKVPEGFVLQRQVKKIIEDRTKMAAGLLPINWGMAEILAYGTLLQEQHAIRFTGQDVGRGTFSHRHSVLHDQNDGSIHLSLAHLNSNSKKVEIYDSLLSEEAVLAFEYGYATTSPNTLTIWEAQFGDFANGAQVVIDQFITSGETKWGRLCGLVMLLPHGYEGQGPEHSSARIERYLQLCAQNNIQVCLPTTPAQVFHMLRRQMLRPLRKPLIVITPKSLLRHKLAVSTLEELANGSFKTVINDDTLKNKK